MKTTTRNPWAWIPTLYFAQGIPYVVVMTVAVIMFKRLGISNTDIALYTSWLYLPWVIKPLWSPIVDLLKTKRWWIVAMQLIIGAALGGIALSIPLPGFFKISLIFMWLLAFSSATHDIAADGFYMLGLKEHQQAYFVGIRSTFYRIAMITGQGLLIILAGFFEVTTGNKPIDIVVEANPQHTASFVLPQGELSAAEREGNSCFVAFPAQAVVSTQNIAIEKYDSVRSAIGTHNRQNGFVAVATASGKATNTNEKSSFWSQYISTPLGNFLREHFQEKAVQPTAQSLTGNITVVAVQLSSKPAAGKEMVLNTKFSKGDNSIKLIEGERLVFNDKNWETPAYLVFQADAKLSRATDATFKSTSGNLQLAWSITFFVLAILFVAFFLYHRFILPRPESDHPANPQDDNLYSGFKETFASFFRKKEIFVIISFLLLYRVAEAQLVKMASPFMLDSRQMGGLGLTTGEVGLIYGTFGILALTLGGILGGVAASRKGLKFWLWPMVMAINLPHMAYVYMAFAQPTNQLIIGLCAAIEQFSYGFGFTAYMLYMIMISEGKNKTAHYAIATGFMALGMMLPGMFSGWLQEIIGYKYFFVWVMICMLPAMLPVFFIKVRPGFGIKKQE